MTGTAQSSVPVGRQEEKARPEPVVVECSMLVRQPPEMSDRQELSGVWVAQVELGLLVGLTDWQAKWQAKGVE